MNDEAPIESEFIPAVHQHAPVQSNGALAAYVKAEVDMQIATAKQYPRSLKRFKDKAKEMACLDPQTAAACLYALPRGGKTIQGPSVRLAEIVAGAYGNMRAGARVVDQDQKFITAQAVCHDMENNVIITIEVKRRCTDKQGRVFNDDMLAVTANAACSIALRNAIFRVVPQAYWADVYEAAKKVAQGDIKSLVARRDGALAYFGKLGVSPERILAVLDKKGIDDIGLEDLTVLTGLKQALLDKETSIEEAFPEPRKPEPAPTPTAEADKLAKQIADRKPRKKDKPTPDVVQIPAEQLAKTQAALEPPQVRPQAAMIAELVDLAARLDVDLDAELDGRKLEELSPEGLEAMLGSYHEAAIAAGK